MAIPIVNLRKRKLKKGHSYLVDYTINGVRYRQAVGKNKRDAEFIKTKIQHELTLGNYDILKKQTKVITLDDLVKDFIEEKRNYIRPKTRNRHTDHFDPFRNFINTFFPKSSMDISLIESHHIKECVDYIADGKADQQWEAVRPRNEPVIQSHSYHSLSVNKSTDAKISKSSTGTRRLVPEQRVW